MCCMMVSAIVLTSGLSFASPWNQSGLPTVTAYGPRRYQVMMSGLPFSVVGTRLQFSSCKEMPSRTTGTPVLSASRGGVEFAGRADESFGENHHRAASFKRLAGFFQHALTLLRHDRNLLQLAV